MAYILFGISVYVPLQFESPHMRYHYVHIPGARILFLKGRNETMMTDDSESLVHLLHFSYQYLLI
jgi:hypothetical protein